MGFLRDKHKSHFIFLALIGGIYLYWISSTKLESQKYAERSEDQDRTINKNKNKEYVINTNSCKILQFKPSHPSVAKHSNANFEKLVCSNKLPLTEASGTSLVFHENRIPDYGSSKSSIKCSYKGISRIEEDVENYTDKTDDRWRLKEQVPIRTHITHISEDGILVTCIDRGRKVYENVHYFMQPRRVEKKKQKFKSEYGRREEQPKKLSILFIGTDSVSRGSLQRLMPETYAYLTKRLHAIDFRGFNKVGDNTMPNLLAMLVGTTKSGFQNHACLSEKKVSKLDRCPFIWKDFAEKGYATIYGEDIPEMWAFHHDTAGFVKEPTDYYPRPYMQVSEEMIGHNGSSSLLERNVCQGPSMTMSVMHNYSLEVAETLRDIPYFGFYWITSLTHDLLNAAALADKPSLNFLERLHNKGYLEHTVLFFLSDHGLRFGDFRSTYAGMLEERLPYMLVVLPQWFKRKYPEAVRNMEINAGRLTSTFDIHATLKDFVNQTYSHPRHRNGRERGQSLFTEISPHRTCEDAQIPQHFCSCEQTKEMDPRDTNLLKAAETVIREINTGLSAFEDCALLELDKVLNGRVWSAKSSTDFGNYGSAVTSYVVVFVTKPGGAMLEATVKREGDRFKLAFNASRINKFGNQSHCISNSLYKSYCYCKDLLS